MTIMKILKPGMYTTIQDIGRYNFQKSGMSVSGAMDQFSLRVANILVGNKDSEACLEATLFGLKIKFAGDALIAVTGANLMPRINNKAIDMWSGIKVLDGDELSFETAQSGCRSYIAIEHGIDVPEVMGSKSTYVKGKVGGFQGRMLKAGDEIKIGASAENEFTSIKKLPNELIPLYSKDNIVRVVMGPQDDYFTVDGINTFFDCEYKVTSEADRMGYRLSGPKISHITSADIISDGITMGSVQIPGDGAPIIMMADRQTTGGYTKIATIITPDINIVGQLKPGDSIRFKLISIEEAHVIYRKYMKDFDSIRESMTKVGCDAITSEKFKVRVNNKEYEVMVQEIK
ncbi:biotin-dependent carboxyltransferase family protein [Clostridium estertheticum]|uniref:5-oxoprolinase subunit C family protein n=1 Tax=Clostridium estertheticum TaxID=238834 RepID=UPI001CF0DE76|nr:biotin-dependent carboxyltransferase family protein [Clostridium estertheticum]MCB2307691.1 biotin-dependent carboxyltransferase family protein [Clostridium estertheticum]MCB2345979.1 biotin-dependent carboxyltransferase family protein [Clostridium estertheticum]MCB2351238.1 biotin-dependent carboxyltransferase family protein [Clostridium estertheticum]WAG44671.1 biotin-dependent carboxyltransferase family protein [Clostridium estertheticum]